MLRILTIVLTIFSFVFIGLPPIEPGAFAAGKSVSQSLSRLANMPRYRGKIIGTHIRKQEGRPVLEVRILRRDDSIILVYIDPKSGRILGDSQR